MARRVVGPVTLGIDVGGTGIKAMRVSARGSPVSERIRIATPRPATPRTVLGVISRIIAEVGPFDRVVVGFPGVVQDGVVRTAPNLDQGWPGMALAERVSALAGKPARALNDAGVQGFGAIEGRGVEVCVTLGTGMGFSLFLDGRYVPNIELGHHPFRAGKTYEDHVGGPALEKIGKRRWRKRVDEVVAQLRETFNFRALYLGGGNARKLRGPFPEDVKPVANLAGLLGSSRVWDEPRPAPPGAPSPRPSRAQPRRRARTSRAGEVAPRKSRAGPLAPRQKARARARAR